VTIEVEYKQDTALCNQRHVLPREQKCHEYCDAIVDEEKQIAMNAFNLKRKTVVLSYMNRMSDLTLSTSEFKHKVLALKHETLEHQHQTFKSKRSASEANKRARSRHEAAKGRRSSSR